MRKTRIHNAAVVVCWGEGGRELGLSEAGGWVPLPTRRQHYYQGGKNLSAHQKMGEKIEALQICKRLTQTASL